MDALLLGRLGGELARMYQDTLHAPLPPRLRMLIEQLDHVVQDNRRGPAGGRNGR